MSRLHPTYEPSYDELARWDAAHAAKQADALKAKVERMVKNTVVRKAQADAITQQNILGLYGIRSSLSRKWVTPDGNPLDGYFHPTEWEIGISPEHRPRAEAILAAINSEAVPLTGLDALEQEFNDGKPI